MKTARFIKQCVGFNGDARLYELSEPMQDNAGKDVSLVIVSATVVAWGSGPETYIFPGNGDGTVADWGELPGSFQGGLDHAEALRRAGYEVAEGGESE